MARILPPTPEAVAEAASALQNGGLVAFPTETVYGLGANALDPEAVGRVFAAKGRPATNPLIVHVASWEDVAALADTATPSFALLAARFWPGPLTLVLPRTALVPDSVTAGGPTVAVRVPRHPVALALLRAAGVPVAAPSANRSERLSPTLAAHVAAGLGDAVDIVLDGGPTDVGLESTVLDLTEWPPRLLRPGMVSAAEIGELLGVPVALGPAPGPARSPGQLPRHYAPRTPLRVLAGEDLWAEAARAPSPVAVLAHTPPPSSLPPSVHLAPLPADPRAYAAALYGTLHALDGLGLSRILVQAVPAGGEWQAIRDRLARAAR